MNSEQQLNINIDSEQELTTPVSKKPWHTPGLTLLDIDATAKPFINAPEATFTQPS